MYWTYRKEVEIVKEHVTGAVVVLQLVRGRGEVREQADGRDGGRKDMHTLKTKGFQNGTNKKVRESVQERECSDQNVLSKERQCAEGESQQDARNCAA